MMQNQLRLCQTLRRFFSPSDLNFVCYKSSSKPVPDLEIPEKPKRPLGVFFRFLIRVSPKIIQEHGNINRSDLLRKAAEMWKEADHATKSNLENEYNNDYRPYIEQLQNYQDSLSGEQKEALLQQFRDKKKSREDKQMKKIVRELGKPKRPTTGFGLFVRSMSKQRPSQVKPPEWLKKVSEMWNTLPDVEKDVYNLESEKLRKVYEIEIQKWTDEVLTQTDLYAPMKSKKNSPKK